MEYFQRIRCGIRAERGPLGWFREPDASGSGPSAGGGMGDAASGRVITGGETRGAWRDGPLRLLSTIRRHRRHRLPSAARRTPCLRPSMRPPAFWKAYAPSSFGLPCAGRRCRRLTTNDTSDTNGKDADGKCPLELYCAIAIIPLKPCPVLCIVVELPCAANLGPRRFSCCLDGWRSRALPVLGEDSHSHQDPHG